MSILDQGQPALEEAEAALQRGADPRFGEKGSARDELWAVVSRIEQQEKVGLSPDGVKLAMRSLKVQLLSKIGRLMDLGI
jgi:hypothetical protein